jgi:hypothetical protein
VLMRAGIAAETVITMRHAASTTDSLRARLGEAAQLTVEEGPHGPRFRRRQCALETGVAGSPVSAPDLPARGIVPPSTPRSSAGSHQAPVGRCHAPGTHLQG